MAPFSVSKWQTRVIAYPLADFNAKSVCRELAQSHFVPSLPLRPANYNQIFPYFARSFLLFLCIYCIIIM